jgi:carbamoyl-phosphate synthase large subunit
MTGAVAASPGHPILIDKFLEDAFELDVDAVADTTGAVVIGGIMEHIEEAGIHSGDSSCVVPPFICPERHLATIRDYTRRIARALKVVGLMNVQYATKDDVVYVLEVNPRASRTVPFAAKATGLPVAKIAAKVMAGMTLPELGVIREPIPSHVSVKEAVFPFRKFAGVDIVLGPEMKSTGEVMGIDREFGRAYAKAQRGAGMDLPTQGTVLVSLRDEDKLSGAGALRMLQEEGFKLVATGGTAEFMRERGLEVESIHKVRQGEPHTESLIRAGGVALVIATTRTGDAAAVRDSASMRRAALEAGIPYFTTVAGARAAAAAIRALRAGEVQPIALQDLHTG